MNVIENDYGKMDIAIGAPGSRERLLIERPSLIERLNRLYDSDNHSVDEAVKLIRDSRISSSMEITTVLSLSRYGEVFLDEYQDDPIIRL